jgi:hypothetical protein
MKYEIIPDSKLNLSTLLDATKPLFTESEIKLLKKSPWTWYHLSEEPPEKNKAFYLDAGYHAFKSVITLDNTLKKALQTSFLENLTIDDLRLKKKIEGLNKISEFMGLTNNQIKSSNLRDAFYECKRAGFEIAEECLSELLGEQYALDVNVTDANRKKFEQLIEYISLVWAETAFVKGSYVEYIESNGTSKKPSDIDLVLIVDHLDKNSYYENMELFGDDAKIDDIPIHPLFISTEFREAYTFFDLDINKNTKFLYNDSINTPMRLRRNPENLILFMGNMSIEKQRCMMVDEDKINDLCYSKNAHSKIASAIRQPEMFYKHLSQNNLGHIVSPPIKLSDDFDRNMPFGEIKRLLAESSIELSRMAQKLNNYMTGE